jgi:hypothetical protein
MTIEIYIQSTEVTLGNRHYGFWIVENGITTILDAKASGTQGANVTSGLFDNIYLEESIVNAAPSNVQIEQFNLNKLFLSQEEATALKISALDYYNSFREGFVYEDRAFIDTKIAYNPVGSNSNAYINSLLNYAEVDIRALSIYENGDSSLSEYDINAHTGAMDLIDSKNAEVFTAFLILVTNTIFTTIPGMIT